MENKKKFAVILSGCGVYDGSEIHEATLAMYAIMKHGATYEIFAPDIMQHHVINHLTGEEMDEKRNVLVESARIARGNIKKLAEFNAADFDALLFPGGFGAAKNLSDYAFKGTDVQVIPDIANAIQQMHTLDKPIGALCISPVLIAKVLDSVELTIGDDVSTAENVNKLGASHKVTSHGQVVVDKQNNIYTTPCYMLDANIVQIAGGAENVVKKMLEDM